MRKVLNYIYIALICALIFMPRVLSKNVDEPISLDTKGIEKKTITLNESVQVLDGKLYDEKSTLRYLFEQQKKEDVEDIELLWNATVESNNVIKFALRKLAIPAEQRRINSSIMAKSLSAFINGAALVPSVMGANSMVSSAVSSGGAMASRAVAKTDEPTESPVTDTELIQLASLIEDLQGRIIKTYYEYKSSLETLRLCREQLYKYNKEYSSAIAANNSDDKIDLIVSSAMYDKQIIEEAELRQKVKYNRLTLERLAGIEVVNNLNLTKIADYADSSKISAEGNKKPSLEPVHKFENKTQEKKPAEPAAEKTKDEKKLEARRKMLKQNQEGVN